MGKTFIFDAAKCNGCRNCQLACKDEHVDNEWLPYSKPQPDTGQFWTRIEESPQGKDRIHHAHVPALRWRPVHERRPRSGV